MRRGLVWIVGITMALIFVVHSDNAGKTVNSFLTTGVNAVGMLVGYAPYASEDLTDGQNAIEKARGKDASGSTTEKN